MLPYVEYVASCLTYKAILAQEQLEEHCGHAHREDVTAGRGFRLYGLGFRV